MHQKIFFKLLLYYYYYYYYYYLLYILLLCGSVLLGVDYHLYSQSQADILQVLSVGGGVVG